MFTALGGNAVPMAWGETFTAVQQGTIDGLEIPLSVIDQNKFFEVTKYLSLTNHTYSAIGLVMSKRTFDKLPADLKKAVSQGAATAIRNQRTVVGKASKEVLASLEAKGMKINQVKDLKPFRNAVTEVYDKVRDQVGADLMKEALAAVK